MTTPLDTSRRQFLQGTGGALIVSFGLAGGSGSVAAAQDEDEALPGNTDDYPELDAWLSINADGTVTVRTGKIELGQGILTAISQVTAEELDVDLDRIDVVSGVTEVTPDEGTTAGSGSMEQSATALTYAAAEARQALLELAADELDAEPDSLTVDDGTVTDENGAETTYWDLLGDELFEREVTHDTQPKPADEQEIVGEPVSRVDIPSKVTGGESYVHDLRRPDMLYGRVVRPPAYGAELRTIDDDLFQVGEDLPGVERIVQDGNFLGVVAEREWQAIQAMETLRDTAEWDVSPTMPEQEEIYDHLQEEATEESHFGQEGDLDTGFDGASETLEADYRRPYQMHASIGPSCAVAEFDDETLRVWSHSQNVFNLKGALSTLLDKPEDEIECTHVEGAGCYGHNGADDVAGDAALLSRGVDGRPVRVQWMREDEHKWEPYGSAMRIRCRGGVDDDATITAWDSEIWSCGHSTRPSADGDPLLAGMHVDDPLEPEEQTPPSSQQSGGVRNGVPDYTFENSRITHHLVPESPLRISALRGLGAFANVFAVESFMDELAHAADADPVEFRLQHLEDSRSADVIREVADLASWGERDLDDNEGVGVAFARYRNVKCYCAVIVQVAVDPDSYDVTITDAYASADSGEIVNPNGIRHQIAGGLTQAASWTFYEEVQFDTERVQSEDWEEYPIMTFDEVPIVEVSVIDRPDEPYMGTGEASQGPTPAAIGNAIYDAVGARVRQIPITPDRIEEALDETGGDTDTG